MHGGGVVVKLRRRDRRDVEMEPAVPVSRSNEALPELQSVAGVALEHLRASAALQ